jgi:hypothetical protein
LSGVACRNPVFAAERFACGAKLLGEHLPIDDCIVAQIER